MFDSRPLQILTSAGAVIDTLGVPVVRKLTGGSPSSISNWRAADRLPPRTVLVLGAALAAIGASAPPSIWGVDDPENAEITEGAV